MESRESFSEAPEKFSGLQLALVGTTSVIAGTLEQLNDGETTLAPVRSAAGCYPLKPSPVEPEKILMDSSETVIQQIGNIDNPSPLGIPKKSTLSKAAPPSTVGTNDTSSASLGAHKRKFKKKKRKYFLVVVEEEETSSETEELPQKFNQEEAAIDHCFVYPEMLKEPIQLSVRATAPQLAVAQTSSVSAEPSKTSTYEKTLKENEPPLATNEPKEAIRKGRGKVPLKPAVISEWQCIPCRKIFRRERGLLQHKLYLHAGDKPYKCKSCGKKFQDEQKLLEHQRHHTAREKSFKCPDCSKQYYYLFDLQRHIGLHHGVPRYNCKFCNKPFDRHDHLLNHETSHVNGTVKRKSKKKQTSSTDNEVTSEVTNDAASVSAEVLEE